MISIIDSAFGRNVTTIQSLITPINLTTNTSDPDFIVERSSIIFNSAAYDSYLMFDNNPNTWWACAVGIMTLPLYKLLDLIVNSMEFLVLGLK